MFAREARNLTFEAVKNSDNIIRFLDWVKDESGRGNLEGHYKYDPGNDFSFAEREYITFLGYRFVWNSVCLWYEFYW